MDINYANLFIGYSEKEYCYYKLIKKVKIIGTVPHLLKIKISHINSKLRFDVVNCKNIIIEDLDFDEEYSELFGYSFIIEIFNSDNQITRLKFDRNVFTGYYDQSDDGTIQFAIPYDYGNEMRKYFNKVAKGSGIRYWGYYEAPDFLQISENDGDEDNLYLITKNKIDDFKCEYIRGSKRFPRSSFHHQIRFDDGTLIVITCHS